MIRTRLLTVGYKPLTLLLFVDLVERLRPCPSRPCPSRPCRTAPVSVAEVGIITAAERALPAHTGYSKLPVYKGDRDFFLNHIKPCVSSEAAQMLGAPIRVEEFEPVFDKHGRLLGPGILKSLPSCRSPGECF